MEPAEDKHPNGSLLDATIERLDEYMELMYEERSEAELRSKIEGTEMIVKLCHRGDNLEILIHQMLRMCGTNVRREI